MRIVIDPEPLDPWHLPSRVLYREAEIDMLKAYLSPLVEGWARRVIVHVEGPPGVGKTAIARRVACELEEEAKVRGVRLKCIYLDTSWLSSGAELIYELLRTLGLNAVRGVGLAQMLRAIGDHLERSDLQVLLVLDDVDVYAQRGRDLHVLYDLARWREVVGGSRSRVHLLLIHRDAGWIEGQEGAFKQSLIGPFIRLREYTRNELRGILAERASIALAPGSLSDELLDFIAALAAERGGPRYGLELIASSAILAERQGSPTIRPEHVRLVHSQLAKRRSIAYRVPDMPMHVRLLLLAIAALLEDDVYTDLSRLQRLYRAYCEAYSVEPKPIAEAVRYLAELGELLVDGGLIALKAPAGEIKDAVLKSLDT